MTDREKLVELLSGVQAGGVALDHEALKANAVQNEEVADYLISNGVTVREMQKPLTVEELPEYLGDIVWREEPFLGLVPIRMFFVGWYALEYEAFGEKEDLESKMDDYNHTWRCWKEKPSDEERQDAGWE